MHRKTQFVGILVTLLLVACSDPTSTVSSTLIRNALIYDGTGSEAFEGAVRIDGDKIIEVGNLEAIDGETVIDAAGLVLAPGFVDTHSHHDRGIADHRAMPAVLSQGITTIVRGADGASNVDDSFDLLTVAAFNANFEALPAAVNVGSFSPHNSIRWEVLGDDHKRPATAEEIAAMRVLVDADMEAGALGLSTGLEYDPGIYSTTDEVIELARAAAAHGGRYMSHLRDEDDHFMEAVAEIIRIGREAELPVKISHIKLADREFFGTTDKVLAVLNEARDAGIDISADIYPYQRWASNVGVLFPDRDFASVETAEFTFAHTGAPQDIYLAKFLPDPGLEGRTIAELARLLEQDPVTVLLSLAQAGAAYTEEFGREGTGIIVKGMDDTDIIAFMQWPFTNICSDGEHFGAHPRGQGSFPRVLGRYVRKLGALTLAEAIHKMTQLSAESVGIANRGKIAAGYYADLVLFDPDAVTDRATMQEPLALSVGIDKVWVNGELAFANGAPTMLYPGRIVHRAAN